MDGQPPTSTSTLLPMLRYRNVGAAVDWLCTAFGFERQVVVRDAEGEVYYAQLAHGDGMVMIGGVNNNAELDKYMRQPDEVGGVETQASYLVVTDIEEHYATARAAGGEILLELNGDETGRRGYSCRDLEGHIWNFGTYDPWKGRRPAAQSAAPAPVAASAAAPARRNRPLAIAATALIGMTAGAALLYALAPTLLNGAIDAGRKRAEATLRASLEVERNARRTAELARETLRQNLARETAAREVAEHKARTARDAAVESAGKEELARERALRELAEREAREAKSAAVGKISPEELARERKAKDEAIAIATELRAAIKEARAAAAAAISPEAFARERKEKDAALATVAELRKAVQDAREAKDVAARAADVARVALAREKDAREALEREMELVREKAAAARIRDERIETAATPKSDAVATDVPAPTVARKAKPKPARAARARPAPPADKKKVAGKIPPAYVEGMGDNGWPYAFWKK